MSPRTDGASKLDQFSANAPHPWQQRRERVAACVGEETARRGRTAEDCNPAGTIGSAGATRDARRATRALLEVMFGLVIAPLWLLLLVASDFSPVAVSLGLLVVLAVVR